MWIVLRKGAYGEAPTIICNVDNVPDVGTVISPYMMTHIPYRGHFGLASVVITEKIPNMELPDRNYVPKDVRGRSVPTFICK